MHANTPLSKVLALRRIRKATHELRGRPRIHPDAVVCADASSVSLCPDGGATAHAPAAHTSAQHLSHSARLNPFRRECGFASLSPRTSITFINRRQLLFIATSTMMHTLVVTTSLRALRYAHCFRARVQVVHMRAQVHPDSRQKIRHGILTCSQRQRDSQQQRRRPLHRADAACRARATA